jgi:pSer/pThr/pTyr-binding forkhead associated (FHA) protein
VPAGRFDAQPPFYLDRPVTLIGSRHRAHIRLESEDVSRSHAIVVNTRGRVIIRDLGSRTRVYVNGREAWEAALADGDYVTIGHFSFRFAAGDVVRYLGGAPEPPAAVLTGPVLAPGGASLDKDLCVIGCRQGADLLLRGSAVSFAHAVVVRHESGYLVRDLGSRTGTFLNGVPIEGDAELRHGSVIRIGPYELRYAAAGEAPRAAAAAAPLPRREPARESFAAHDPGLVSEAPEDLPVLAPAEEAADVPAAAEEEAFVAAVGQEPPVERAAPGRAPAPEAEQAPVAEAPAAIPSSPPPLPETPPALPAMPPALEAVPPALEAAAPVPPAEPRPVADVPVARAARSRAPRKKKAAKPKVKPRREVEEASPEDFAPLAPLIPPAPVIPLDAVTVVLPPAPPEPAALTNVTMFLPPLEPLAEPDRAFEAPAGQTPPSPGREPAPVPQAAAPVPQAAAPVPQAAAPVPQAAAPVPQAAAPVRQESAPPRSAPAPVEEAPAPLVHDELPALEADFAQGPAPSIEPVIEEPAFEELAPPEVSAGETGAAALDEFGFEARAFEPPADAAAAPEFSAGAAPGPQPVPAATTRPELEPEPAREAARPPEAVRRWSRPGPRGEPAKPPPTNWGVLATAIAITELPPEGAAPPPAFPDPAPADKPARRSSRLKWFTAGAVLLVGVAATVVAVFGHSALLKFLR